MACDSMEHHTSNELMGLKMTPDQLMAKKDGQIFQFLKTANGHGHSPNRQNSNRRMASQNFIFSLPQRSLRTDPDTFWT